MKVSNLKPKEEFGFKNRAIKNPIRTDKSGRI